MCGGNCCHSERERCHSLYDFAFSMMDEGDEIKMFEEYKEVLVKELEKVNKRLEVLRH